MKPPATEWPMKQTDSKLLSAQVQGYVKQTETKWVLFFCFHKQEGQMKQADTKWQTV